MIRSRIELFWRQLRERIQLLNGYPDSRPPRDEARNSARRQRTERHAYRDRRR